MDDIVILARNKNEAKEYLNEIKEFLQKKLELELMIKLTYLKQNKELIFADIR